MKFSIIKVGVKSYCMHYDATKLTLSNWVSGKVPVDEWTATDAHVHEQCQSICQLDIWFIYSDNKI